MKKITKLKIIRLTDSELAAIYETLLDAELYAVSILQEPGLSDDETQKYWRTHRELLRRIIEKVLKVML